MSTTNSVATSAAHFVELEALRGLSIHNALHDAYMAIGHALGSSHILRMSTVLNVQRGVEITPDDWEVLAGPGVTMIKSDLCRLTALKKSIDAVIAVNQEVLRSWNPEAADLLDSQPTSRENLLLGWQAPASGSSGW
jgi:hypothetical protein